MKRMEEFLKKHILATDIVLAFLVSFLVTFFFSTGTSILYVGNNSDYASIDSNFFNYEAYLLLHGKTPYVDFYDHKGVLHIYIDALGLLIGGKYGVWALEIIVNTASLFLLLRSVNQLFRDSLLPRLFVLSFFSAFTVLIFGGNQEGEWILPLLTGSILFFLKGINSKDNRHFLISAIFAGLQAGCALNIRMSDAAWGFSMAVALGVYALRHKLYKPLLAWAGVCLGSLLLVEGIMISVAYGCGYLEMMFKALMQNFSYISNYRDSLASRWIQRGIHLVLIGMVIFVCLRSWHDEEKKDINLFFLSVLLPSSIVYIVIARYLVYYWSGLSFYCILVLHWLSILSIKQINLKRVKMVTTSILFGIVLAFSITIPTCYYVSDFQGCSYNTYLKVKEDLLTIPEEARSTEGEIVGIDVNPAVYMGSYINPLVEEKEILPGTRIYCYQSWWSRDNPEIEKEFVEYMLAEKPTYVLRDIGRGDGFTLKSVTSILDEHYELYQGRRASENNGKFDIYVLKGV